ncbi:MAG: hypothetical protein M0R75_11575 [Dehalococcoidia bacterium]|nr:hypothetical protein [Dehalococcoidia bacterium]
MIREERYVREPVAPERPVTRAAMAQARKQAERDAQRRSQAAKQTGKGGQR